MCNIVNATVVDSLDPYVFCVLGEEEDDDPDFDPSKVKGGENPQECKQQ